MKHLISDTLSPSVPVSKVLANWQTASAFIYDDPSTTELKALLRQEVLNKNRDMIIERITVRLLSAMKQEIRDELGQDIKELRQEAEGVREEDRAVPQEDD